MKIEIPNFDSLWNYNKPSESETAFRKVLAETEGKTDVSYQAELLSQIARAQGLQSNFAAGHQTLDKAEGLGEGSKRARVRVLLERGRLFYSNQTPEKAIPFFEKALDLAREAGEENLAIDAAHMLGIAAPEGERMDWNLKALEMAETARDEKARNWRGSLYNNIGYEFMEAGDYAKAMEMFQKLLEYTSDKGDKEFANVAYWFIAKVQRLRGDLEDALAGQLALLEAEKGGDSASAYTLEELGEIYLALGQDEKRRAYFGRAHEAFHSDERYTYEVEFEAERLERIKRLSED